MKSPRGFIVSEGKYTGACREHTAICSMLLASTSNRLMKLTVLLALAHSKAHVSLERRGTYGKKVSTAL
jgi:hypothetical protein